MFMAQIPFLLPNLQCESNSVYSLYIFLYIICYCLVSVCLYLFINLTSSELQELVDRLDRVSRKYSLLISVDKTKTKVMASDSIVCHILIQNELLEQVDTFPYLGSVITEDGECTTE